MLMSADISNWVKNPGKKIPTSTALKIFLTVLTAPAVAACSSSMSEPGLYNFNNTASEAPDSPVTNLFRDTLKTVEIQKGPDERDFWRVGHYRLGNSLFSEMGDLTIFTDENIDKLTPPDGYFLRGFLQRADGKPLTIRNIKISETWKEFGKEKIAPENYFSTAVNIGFNARTISFFDNGVRTDIAKGMKLYLAQVNGNDFSVMPGSQRIYNIPPR